MPSPIAAANAYAALAKLKDAGAGGMPLRGIGEGKQDGGFGAMLNKVLAPVMEAGQKSDAQMKAMVSGKSNIVDVVTAVAETEVAVEAMVSIRDKVISSYEEIMRMPI
jgi:flagellar hook-basal body complex protein FliE